MNTKDFEEFIQQCSEEIPGFYTKAKWSLIDSDEHNSVCVTVEVVINLEITDHPINNVRTRLICESVTQNSSECIKNAVAVLNGELLTKIDDLINGLIKY